MVKAQKLLANCDRFDREFVTRLYESNVVYALATRGNRFRTTVADAYFNRAKPTTHKKVKAADEFARKVGPIINGLILSGMKSRREIAAELERRGVATANGGRWHPTTVNACLRRSRAL